MKFSFLQLPFLAATLILAGCATSPNAVGPGSAPSPSETRRNAELPDSIKESTALPPGEFAVLIESLPDGGTVVVNGIPVGKAPQRVILPGTTRGFFREQVSVKVRFIAGDGTQRSQTVEELLTPLDRIPATVRFTPTGTTRVPR